MILVNNLCDFHDLYSYFTLCNVCYVFQRAKSRHFIYFIYLLSRNSTISTTKKCFNYRRSHLNFLCGLITMEASTESVQAFSERFVPALELFETTSLYHPCLRGMGGLQAEMFLRVLLMLGFVSFWQICPSGEQIAKHWC